MLRARIVPVIKPVPFRPDWFSIGSDEERVLHSVPGVDRRKDGAIWCHMTHLPLLVDQFDQVRPFMPAALPADPEAREALDAETMKRGFALRLHQHAALEFMLSRRNTLLADEQRVGKTLAALMAHDPRRGPLVVICPLMVRQVWLTWINRVFPDLSVGVMAGKKFDPAVAKNDVIVGHYDVLYGWQGEHRSGTMILDEAHLLANARSRRSTAAQSLAHYSQKVIALTGTPIWNLPKSAYLILSLVAPGAFGGAYDFGLRYGDPELTAHGTKFRGASHSEELATRMAPIMLRRRHVDIQANLPRTNREILIVEASLREKQQVAVAAEKIRVAGTRTNTIGAMTRYRKVVGRLKVDKAIEFAQAIQEQGEPLVVWTWHRDIAEMIAQRLLGSHCVTGDDDVKKREAAFALWKSETNTALVLTISVGQVGIDLSHARRELFVEVDYTPALIAQAEMRPYSPTRPMYVSFLVVDHESDRRVVAALVKKLEASRPLGVSAAEDSIDILRELVSPEAEAADLERLADSLIKGLCL